MPRKKYDCLKCPGYCCSYPIIEVKDRDAARIAKHFDMPLDRAEKKYFRVDRTHGRVMRRQKDGHFGRICQFFDTELRRCTIYEARPRACREFPGEFNCGYWDFLAFERNAQEDEDYVSTTWHMTTK
ncbi:MAG: YkgJ family cysteine cluster protein [Hyphomicrobiales bacterium]